MPGLTNTMAHDGQRGAATLALTLLLFFVMTLMLGFTNRSLLFENRASANQYRATQAFEAAEAGLEWAQALLNTTHRIGADCRPGSAAANQPFRTRYLRRGALDAAFTPRTRLQGGTEVTLRAACVHAATGWACGCPADSEPAPPVPADTGVHPAFSLEFARGSQPGTVRVAASGCTSLAPPCSAGAERADAHSRMQIDLALVPGLVNLPAAPLTVRGGIQELSAAPGIRNAAATSSGITVLAGAGIELPHARLSVPPGSSTAASLVAHDAALAAASEEQFFHRVFRMGKPRWTAQPVVTAVNCPQPCNQALDAVLTRADDAPQLLWIAADLVLDGGITIGSPERPVVLVVDGEARWRGAVTLYGLLYASGIRWDDTPAAGALLRGAAVSTGGYAGNGSPELVYDRPLLERLASLTGTFARIPGSWRDF